MLEVICLPATLSVDYCCCFRCANAHCLSDFGALPLAYRIPTAVPSLVSADCA
jgi:hypothetical protein